MDDDVVAVVLAGGFGTRIRHLLPDLPKPMAPVCGRPFAEWVVRFLAAQGIRKVLLSTGYLAEKIEQHFRDQPVDSVLVRCYRETTPLGTAGGFLNAAHLSGEQPAGWLVLNGDSLVLSRIAPLIATKASADLDGAILGRKVPDAERYGTLSIDANGYLRRFAEKQPGNGVINAGVYFLKRAIVERAPARRPLSFEQELFPEWLEHGSRIRVEAVEDPFLDIGTEETLKEAEGFILQNRQWFLG